MGKNRVFVGSGFPLKLTHTARGRRKRYDLEEWRSPLLAILKTHLFFFFCENIHDLIRNLKIEHKRYLNDKRENQLPNQQKKRDLVKLTSVPVVSPISCSWDSTNLLRATNFLSPLFFFVLLLLLALFPFGLYHRISSTREMGRSISTQGSINKVFLLSASPALSASVYLGHFVNAHLNFSILNS